MNVSELRERMQACGLVGAGGAGFPSYGKLADGAEYILINGAECEPLLYTDYILLREYLPKVLGGAESVRAALGAKEIKLCLKEHTATRLSLKDGDALAEHSFVKVLPNVYPIGDEISLIYQATGRVVQPGKLPISEGAIVYNVETAYGIYRAVTENIPVYETFFTVGGDVATPCVASAPIGMPIREVLSQLGCTVTEDHALIVGGPAMGKLENPNTAVITKTTKGILLLPKNTPAVQSKEISLAVQLRRGSSACCQCTRCTDMCPRFLLGYPLEPHRLMRAATSAETIPPISYVTATLCCSCGICEMVACCQDLSPRAVILKLKESLAKEGLRYAEPLQAPPSSARDARMIPSDRLMALLGVSEFDRIPEYRRVPLQASQVEIPMRGHIGTPSVPAVSVGDAVKAGDLIANCGQKLSLPQHASVNGIVTYVDETKIVLEARP